MSKTEQDRRILHALAAADPDFAAFRAKFSAASVPDGLAPEILRDVLAVLGEDPRQAANMNALRSRDDACKSFAGGTEAAALAALVFLLRTHVKVQRTATGKWHFQIEHKPADSKLLSALLDKLEQLFGSSGS